jgi:hypothetical protein
LAGTPIFAPSGQAPIFKTPPFTGEGPVGAGDDAVVVAGGAEVVETGTVETVEAVEVDGFETVEVDDDRTGEGEFGEEMGEELVLEVVEEEHPVTNKLINSTNDIEIAHTLAIFTNFLLLLLQSILTALKN